LRLDNVLSFFATPPYLVNIPPTKSLSAIPGYIETNHEIDADLPLQHRRRTTFQNIMNNFPRTVNSLKGERKERGIEVLLTTVPCALMSSGMNAFVTVVTAQ
jgi:hypothetical protein